MSDLKDLTIEELLELAKIDAEDDETIPTKPHIIEFVKDNEIVSGTTLVPTFVIFMEYRRFWRTESRTKLSKIDFFRNFSNLFEKKRKTHTRYYLLNEGSFDLSEENLRIAKEHDRRYEKKRQIEKLEKSKRLS